MKALIYFGTFLQDRGNLHTTMYGVLTYFTNIPCISSINILMLSGQSRHILGIAKETFDNQLDRTLTCSENKNE